MVFIVTVMMGVKWLRDSFTHCLILIKYNADLIINIRRSYTNELVIYDEVNIILEILWITQK